MERSKEITSKELKDAWKLKEVIFKCEDKNQEFHSYVAEQDYNEMKNVFDFLTYYRTDVLPQPFFGNLEYPEIIVLALNPGYDLKKEKEEFDAIEKYIKEKEIKIENFISNTSWINNVNYCTKAWWVNTFKDLIEGDNLDSILDKVGIFNLCGYHSVRYARFPNGLLNNNKTLFPTQEKLRDYLQTIMSKVKLIIIIWGKKEWESFFKENSKNTEQLEQMELFKNKKIVIVNKNNSVCHTIINSPDIPDANEFKRVFKNYLVDGKINKLIDVLEKEVNKG